MNIILIGLRGTGKSSIGQALAEHLGWNFIDIDDEVEHELGEEIGTFVEKNGWDAFRKTEKAVALDLAKRDDLVISTGGGTVMDPISAAALKKNGTFIFMYADLKVLAQRLGEDDHRPSLTGAKSAIEEIEEVWAQRLPTYEKLADVAIDVSEQSDEIDHDVRRKAEQILEELANRGILEA
jgi:shikimate kinase